MSRVPLGSSNKRKGAKGGDKEKERRRERQEHKKGVFKNSEEFLNTPTTLVLSAERRHFAIKEGGREGKKPAKPTKVLSAERRHFAIKEGGREGKKPAKPTKVLSAERRHFANQEGGREGKRAGKTDQGLVGWLLTFCLFFRPRASDNSGRESAEEREGRRFSRQAGRGCGHLR